MKCTNLIEAGHTLPLHNVIHFRYSIMQLCWKMDPNKRPSFSLLVETISKTLAEKADYLTVEISLDHYDSSSGHAEEV